MNPVQFKMLLACLLFLSVAAVGKAYAQDLAADASKPKYRVAGMYDTLYITVEEFRNIKKRKLVLQYFLGDDSRFSLKGWTARGLFGRRFEKEPGLSLKNGEAGALKYESQKTFGGLLISCHDMKKIRKKVRTSLGTDHVLFAPTLTEFNQVAYLIMYTNTYTPEVSTGSKRSRSTTASANLFAPRPFVFREVPAQSTGVIANPSPPKNFY